MKEPTEWEDEWKKEVKGAGLIFSIIMVGALIALVFITAGCQEMEPAPNVTPQRGEPTSAPFGQQIMCMDDPNQPACKDKEGE